MAGRGRVVGREAMEGRTIKLAKHAVDGSRAATARHLDVESVLVFLVCHVV